MELKFCLGDGWVDDLDANLNDAIVTTPEMDEVEEMDGFSFNLENSTLKRWVCLLLFESFIWLNRLENYIDPFCVTSLCICSFSDLNCYSSYFKIKILLEWILICNTYSSERRRQNTLYQELSFQDNDALVEMDEGADISGQYKIES